MNLYYKEKKERVEFIMSELKTFLNKNFKTVQVEKYSNAIVKLVQDEAYKVIKKNNAKISQREKDRMQQYATDKLRLRYGPYISVFQTSKTTTGCNLNLAFKTEQGRIYSAETIINVFFTSHCLERFEERFLKPLENSSFLINFRLKFHKTYRIYPTPLDIINNFLEKHTIFGMDETHFYILLNFWKCGFLVFDYYPDGNIFVANTYLDFDMYIKNSKDVKWYGLYKSPELLGPCCGDPAYAEAIKLDFEEIKTQLGSQIKEQKV